MRVPDEYKGLENLELVLKFLGDKERGELSATKQIAKLAIMSTPADLNRVLILTQTLEKQKDYKKLSTLYDEMLKKYPGNSILLNVYAWMLATAEDEKYRNPEMAVKLARKAVELTDEANGAILDTLAVALYAKGDLKEAVKYIKMAVTQCPNVPEVAERAKKYQTELE